MNLNRLHEILRDCTKQLRKGEVMKNEGAFGMSVLTIDAMPHADAPGNDGLEKVDLHFLIIGVDKAIAESHRAELVGLLNAYPQVDRLEQGPSYIEVGGEIGDQGAAFQLFALGNVLGFWDVITPGKMGFSGKEADSMAGNGFVMITGYRPAP